MTNEIIRADSLASGLMGAFDGLLSNRMTGMGTVRDKGEYTEVNTAIAPLKYTEIGALYRKSGVIQRAINTYPNDSMQAGWEFEIGSDDEDIDIGKFDNYLRRLKGWKLKRAIQRASFYSRLHGDGFILLGTADNNLPDEPLELDAIKSLRWLMPLSRKNITPIGDWRNPEHYELTQMGINDGLRFHASRVVRFVGVELDDYELERNAGFNDSVVQSFWNSFCAYHPGLQAASIMVQDHRLRVLKKKGLIDALKADQDSGTTKNQKALHDRVLVNDLSRSTARTEILDLEKEDLVNLVNNYAGVDKIIEQLKDAWASDADMSRIRLFNMIGVSGLQSGEAFKMAQLDHAYRLNSWMENKLGEPLTRIYEVAIAAQDSPIDKGFEHWSIGFPLLYKMTPIEEMEYQLLAAERDAQYLGMGVFQATEIRNQFFGSKPNFNIVLDEEHELLEEEEEEEEEIRTDAWERRDGDWLVFFGGHRTGIAVSASDRNEAIRKARKKKKRGGTSATARQMTGTERRQAKAGRWIRTGKNHEKPGESNLRGYGPAAKKHRKDSLPPASAIQKAQTALEMLAENPGLEVNPETLAIAKWLVSFE